MNANARGCLYMLGLLVFAFFACFLFPFIILPQAGTAVALPVITVPPEYYLKDWPSADFEIVNTLGGALLANVIVLLIAFGARRASKNWTQEVPGRFQAFVEVLGGGFWGIAKNQAGDKPKVRNILFPLVASIFLFLLAANWGKLIPGVESVGVLHCAVYEPVPFNGLPVQETSLLGAKYFVLRNESVLNTGTTATPKDYYRCQAMLGVDKYAKEGYLPTALDPFLDKAVMHVTEEGDTLESIAAKFNARVAEITAQDVAQFSEQTFQGNYVTVPYEGWAELNFTGEGLLALNPSLKAGEAKPTDDGHGEAAATDAAHGADAAHSEAKGLTPTTPLAAGQTVTLRPEVIGGEATTLHNQLFTVAPFVRGVTTDLNFTLGLAIMAVIVIQAFGVSELGLGYFQKFINIGAIGSAGKRPLGVIDFVVGLFEIVSELGKVISLAFRLFGALFAGSVLYAVILFLVGTTIPALILGLEIIVGGAQAAVFAILTLIFSAQAMVSHHHDEDHDHAEAH
ncbi:MAG: F0F1 ATP synthase subunit A [Anaerolineae bacterium]|nr:F0F1 ATP synthase subunit A [Anaerolineae bacterium]